MKYIEKKEKLIKIIKDLLKDKFILAFSGGVDSALIMKLASLYRESENDVRAMFFKAMSTTKEEEENAIRLAREMGVDLVIREVDILTNDKIAHNAKDRCYHCKKTLFSEAIKLKEDLAFGAVVDGTNTDDHKVYRPGLMALRDLGVVSPLNEAGFSKADVRRLAEELDLRVAKKPSAPCLLTRFPYGTEIKKEKLDRLEMAEGFIRSLGYGKFRIRDHDDLARLEIEKADFPKFFKEYDLVVKKLKDLGYSYVCLDMEGFRSGSMDINLSKEEKDKYSL
ncbi:ATP-dependent sacrificial sulfur transferase LarE [uncultured Anaerococcus sp.]|uniref:ATP-dependent sacrificial sulfur transferase LarE n=1 Tax=uncultured Anaerococcus sp. TaxID=293428 RepID=UPI00288B8ECC|nr:ATP-dependent sacrificial sulfur transferase LarE [uncultured Anaerococcus sp.]